MKYLNEFLGLLRVVSLMMFVGVLFIIFWFSIQAHPDLFFMGIIFFWVWYSTKVALAKK
jgi:hypothetical protein